MIVNESLIVESIKTELDKHPFIKRNKLLIESVYKILHAYFIQHKKYIICEFPTGSGKTIIGLLTFFCYRNILEKMETSADETYAYFLTSSKILQDQIERDINNFGLHSDMSLLKGLANYQCTKLTKELGKPVFYDKRPCRSLSGEALAKLDCFATCPYKVARLEASESDCAVFNYAYFLNIMRSEFNPFFSIRPLTIADECHLLPDIVCNMFNFELTPYIFNGMMSNINAFQNYFGASSDSKYILDRIDWIIKGFQMVKLTKANCWDKLSKFKADFTNIEKSLESLINNYKESPDFRDLFESTFGKYQEQLSDYSARISVILQIIKDRPEDLFIENEVAKYVVRDLSEHRTVRDNFLSKIDRGLFMSATIGNAKEFAELMGMEPNDYLIITAPSTFDFSKSPIYLCNSGKLSYAEFDKNIDKVLSDMLRICMKHKGERGVIHTGTFNITNKIQELVVREGIEERFIFYDSSNREQAIQTFINSKDDKILVGPSLYEGLDLKDDMCRFQILVKVPYTSLTKYIRAKMDRYPFWYQRNCNEKIIQAIGRSNRHTNDWSVIYLLDSLFNRVAFDLNDSITSRLKMLRK